MSRMVQADGFAPLTALTISGGATPSVTGPSIDISKSDGNLSLFLINAGASITLTVTYQFGYITRANESTQTITWIVPEGGGTIVNLTAVNIATSSKHETISVDPTMYIRFICANNAAAQTAVVSLYVVSYEP